MRFKNIANGYHSYYSANAGYSMVMGILIVTYLLAVTLFTGSSKGLQVIKPYFHQP